jgi:hypothetical protein
MTLLKTQVISQLVLFFLRDFLDSELFARIFVSFTVKGCFGFTSMVKSYSESDCNCWSYVDHVICAQFSLRSLLDLSGKSVMERDVGNCSRESGTSKPDVRAFAKFFHRLSLGLQLNRAKVAK